MYYYWQWILFMSRVWLLVFTSKLIPLFPVRWSRRIDIPLGRRPETSFPIMEALLMPFSFDTLGHACGTPCCLPRRYIFLPSFSRPKLFFLPLSLTDLLSIPMPLAVRLSLLYSVLVLVVTLPFSFCHPPRFLTSDRVWLTQAPADPWRGPCRRARWYPSFAPMDPVFCIRICSLDTLLWLT